MSGLVTLLKVGLKWWAPLDHNDKDWKTAVEDITSCLQHMTDLGAVAKRKRDAEEPKPKQKRSKKTCLLRHVT
jgi:hypothetical protein